MQVEFFTHPDAKQRLGDCLREALTSGEWLVFRAAIAFLKRSGSVHLAGPLQQFSRTGAVLISVGIDHGGTTIEALRGVYNAIQPNGKLVICHNRRSSTFHPKVHLFESKGKALALIGSGNWTEGGLFTNYEAFTKLTLDKSVAGDCVLLAQIVSSLDKWSDPEQRLAVPVSDELLALLEKQHRIPTEAEASANLARSASPKPASEASPTGEEQEAFSSIPVPAAPKMELPKAAAAPPKPKAADSSKSTYEPAPPENPGTEEPTPVPAAQPVVRYSYLMTLQRTDVGRGQTTKGAAARSPEIFIPLAARDSRPEFWGWPDKFEEDSAKEGKFDRSSVPMRLNGSVIYVNMMTWPLKHDFRLRSADLRDSANENDLMVMTEVKQVGAPAYNVEIVAQGTPRYAELMKLCTTPVRNSHKQFGYAALKS